MSLTFQFQNLLAQIRHHESARRGACLPLAEKLATLLSSIMLVQLDAAETLLALKCFNVCFDSLLLDSNC